MRILNTEEAQRALAEAADTILENYRNEALALVPEALEGLQELVAERDRVAILRLLQGVQILRPGSRQEVEFKKADPTECTKEEKLHSVAFGHFPSSECPDQCRGVVLE